MLKHLEAPHLKILISCAFKYAMAVMQRILYEGFQTLQSKTPKNVGHLVPAVATRQKCVRASAALFSKELSTRAASVWNTWLRSNRIKLLNVHIMVPRKDLSSVKLVPAGHEAPYEHVLQAILSLRHGMCPFKVQSLIIHWTGSQAGDHLIAPDNI